MPLLQDIIGHEKPDSKDVIITILEAITWNWCTTSYNLPGLLKTSAHVPRSQSMFGNTHKVWLHQKAFILIIGESSWSKLNPFQDL